MDELYRHQRYLLLLLSRGGELVAQPTGWQVVMPVPPNVSVQPHTVRALVACGLVSQPESGAGLRITEAGREALEAGGGLPRR